MLEVSAQLILMLDSIGRAKTDQALRRQGLGVLFGKLQQGVIENQQVLTIARMRADAEDAYGLKLGEIQPAVDRLTGGFARDDGASVRKVS
jgi:hypothetical protein